MYWSWYSPTLSYLDQSHVTTTIENEPQSIHELTGGMLCGEDALVKYHIVLRLQRVFGITVAGVLFCGYFCWE